MTRAWWRIGGLAQCSLRGIWELVDDTSTDTVLAALSLHHQLYAPPRRGWLRLARPARLPTEPDRGLRRPPRAVLSVSPVSFSPHVRNWLAGWPAGFLAGIINWLAGSEFLTQSDLLQCKVMDLGDGMGVRMGHRRVVNAAPAKIQNVAVIDVCHKADDT